MMLDDLLLFFLAKLHYLWTNVRHAISLENLIIAALLRRILWLVGIAREIALFCAGIGTKLLLLHLLKLARIDIFLRWFVWPLAEFTRSVNELTLSVLDNILLASLAWYFAGDQLLAELSRLEIIFV